MRLDRREGETDLAYHKRLIEGKLVDKTLADLDYSELSEFVYGKSYSQDVARRMFYGSAKTLGIIDAQKDAQARSEPAQAPVSPTDSSAKEDVCGELDDKILSLQVERQKFFDQRREFGKLVTSLARRESLEDRIIHAAETLNETSPLTPGVYDGNPCDGEAVVVLSDWHYGMTCDNIWNAYNIAVCRERVTKFCDYTIEELKLHRPRKLHIVLLGDFAHGAIHTTCRVASEENTCEQIMHVSELLAQVIASLSAYSPETVVYSTYGNHLRTIQNKNDSQHDDNMERVIPWWLERRLAGNGNISFAKPEYYEFLFLQVCGYNICATHGDLDDVRSAGMTINTIFTKKFGKPIDYILLGDKHHLDEFETMGIESAVVGGLCGSDEYANDRRKYSIPRQYVAFFNDGRGKGATYTLNLDD